MRTTERNAKPTSTPTAGCFAPLAGLLHVKGSGAPKIAGEPRASSSRAPRGVALVLAGVVSALCAMAAIGLVALPSVALAAAPEVSGVTVADSTAVVAKPSTEAVVRGVLISTLPVTFTTALPPEKPETISPAKSITATTATLEGVLNPTKAGEEGTYQFLYRVSATECEGESAAPSQPAGVMSGAVKQAVSVPVTALQPNATYTFCLLARNAAGETAVGPAVHFTTEPAPPTIVSESASHHNNSGQPLNPGEARLEGVVNPNNQLTECHFQYGEASVAEHEVSCEPKVLEGFGEQSVAAVVGGLQPGNTYHYQIIAKNGKGEEAPLVEQTVIPEEAPALPTAPEPATTVLTATSAMLHGVLNPLNKHEVEPGSYEFVYRQSASECRRTNRETGLPENENATPQASASGHLGEKVQAEASGLLPGATYTFCLLARDQAEETAVGPPATFTTLAVAPAIESESVADVTVDSVSLQAQIDPGGAETTYHFEYGTSEAYGQSTPESAPIGGGAGGLLADARLQGLQAATIYHYRVVARNAKGSVAGADRTFTTQGTGASFALPDGREWELVSPANKEGVPLERPIGQTDQTAANGDAVTYQAGWGTEPNPEGNSRRVTVLSARGPDGWVSRDLVPLHITQTGTSFGPQEYKLFSEDLSVGVVEPKGGFNPGLAPDASEQTPYLHTNFPPDEPGAFCTSSCYRPLVTGCPPVGEQCPLDVQENADVPPGTVFGFSGGEGTHCPPQHACGPEFMGATPDLSHVILYPAGGALIEGAPKGSLYEWSADRPPSEQLQFVSVLPPNGEGKELPVGGEGTELSLGGGGAPGHTDAGGRVVHAISRDGARVVWSAHNGSGRHLYLRDMVKGKTVQLDAVQGGQGGVGGESAYALYQGASSDDSRVFFTDREPLTPGAGDSDLYECAIVETATTLRCELSDLATEVGDVLGSSEDGSWLYFTEGSQIVVRHDGVTRPVADDELAGSTGQDWYRSTVRVSPNGEWLAFMSDGSPTGYDNRDAASGQLDGEVYLYDAAADDGAGKLICASCNPTGARPHGRELSVASLASGGVEEGRWVAANVPTWIEMPGAYFIDPADYQPRYLSDEGRLFFNSSDALVPLDTNGTEDVYEYEPVGVASCSEGVSSGSSVFVPASGGCVSLISSGTSSLESAFLDASENGDDVFFESYAKLVPQQNIGVELNVYDAHACSAQSPCPPPAPLPPPACEGDACQSPVGAPEDPTPGSFTYRGPGDLVPALVSPPPLKKVTKKAVKCKRPKKLSHGRCIKPKRKTRAKRASNDRRAQS